MAPENRKGPLGQATPSITDWLAGKSEFDNSPIHSPLQRRAAARLAAVFGSSSAVALVVAGLAGLGGDA